MRYVLMIAYEPSDFSQADEATQQAFFDAHHAFEAFVDAHGRRLSSAALGDTDTATTLRRSPGDGGTAATETVTDGPFVETVEFIGGYYDVDLPDLDHALAAARLLPVSYTIEIRPVVGVEGYEST